MSRELISTLFEQRNRALTQGREIVERAAAEGRAELSAEEEQSWQRANADVSAIDARMDALIKNEERGQAFDQSMANLTNTPVDERRAPEADHNEHLRRFLSGETRSYEVPAERINFRTLGKSVQGTITTSGAAVVPISFYGQLLEHMTESAQVMSAGAFILNTESGEELQIPKTTAHGSAALVAEGGTLAASDPTLAQLSLRSFKYGRLVQLSSELVKDKGVDLEGYIARDSGRALGNAFGAHLVTGTGTTQPRGVLTDATLGVTGPVGTSVSFGTQSTVGQGGDLLIDLYHSVISPYRNSASCAWLMRDATAASVRKLKNSQGDYIWQNGLVPGAPDTILGKPVYFDPNMPAVGVSAKSVLFGDLSTYFVRLVGGVRYERSDDYAFNTDLITYRAIMRADAALTDVTGSVKYFAHSAT